MTTSADLTHLPPGAPNVALVDPDGSVGVRAAERPLDFYGNKSPNGWPECALKGLRIASSLGRYLPVKCGLNSCPYCYRLKCFERAQMVYEDALVEQPRYSLTLTTRAPVWDAAAYREGKKQVLRALRSEFGRVEALEFIEQTTGKAPRSGGKRRGHGHSLLKGPGPGHVLDLERIVVPIWERITGAWHVNVSELAAAGGAVAYLTLNLAIEKHKGRQMPTGLPKGTRTMRATRGYWSLPVDELRERAKDHNRRRRLSWRLAQEGVPADVLAFAVEWELEALRSATYRVVKVSNDGGGRLLQPMGEMPRRMSDAEKQDLLAAAGRRLTSERRTR